MHRQCYHACQVKNFHIAVRQMVLKKASNRSRAHNHGYTHLCDMWLQAHVSQLAMKHILAALAQHPHDVDIQAKGLVALGVLGQVWT